MIWLLAISLSIAKLPDEPLWSEKVNALIIHDDYELSILDANSAKFRVNRAIKIYNENGKSFGKFRLFENKYIKIKKVKGKIINESGKTLKKLDKDDIIKANVSPGYVLYDDSKYQYFELEWHTYPYIVEYEYELKYSSLYFWPAWYPQYKIPVLKSSYTLHYMEPFEYYTHAIGIKSEPQTVTDGKKVTQTWELIKIEPFEKEDWMPAESRTQIALLFTPAQFRLEDYTGTFQSWSEFGKLFSKLSEGRYNLTPEMCTEVRQLTSNVKNDEDKIRVLYKYLQDYTRYVAVALGIGGLQPYPASVVCLNKYGDCKDLTTFMIGMAMEAGIKAYPVLVKTRDEGVVVDDFPSDQFNHVIACVPLRGDTIWLECTADNLVAGELPPNDEGCFVLVITEDGGKLVRTPISGANTNKVISRIDAKLLNDATLLFSGDIIFEGNSAYTRRRDLSGERPEKRTEWMTSNVLGKYAPKLTVSNCHFQNLSANYDLPLISKFKGSIEKFAVTSRNRIFFNPAFLHRETARDIPKEKKRKYPINYSFPFTLVDTFKISVPTGYMLEAAPEPQNINTSFGQYIMDYHLSGQSLEYVRIMRIDKKLIPPEDYQEYLEFIKTAAKTDKSKFVLAKKY